MMHPDVEEAIEEIDAAIFSGDTFYDKDARSIMSGMLARWQRGLNEIQKFCEEEDGRYD